MTNPNPTQAAQAGPDVSALQAQIDQLQGELDRQRRTEQEQRLASLPADQRPLYQRQMENEEYARRLQAREAELESAAKKIHARDLAFQIGLPADELLKYNTREEMDNAAREFVQETMRDPARLRQLADLQERISGKAPSTQEQKPAEKPAEEPGAPGAERAPAGVGGASGGTAAQSPSAADEVTKKYAGRGEGDLASWLQDYRNAAPAQAYSFNTQGSGTPEVLAPQSQPASQPAQPASQPAQQSEVPAGAPA